MAVTRSIFARWFATLLLAALWANNGFAHVRSESFSHWDYEDGLLTARITITARDAARIPPPAPGMHASAVLSSYLGGIVEAHDATGRCTADGGFRPQDSSPGYVQLVGHWRCSGPPQLVALPGLFNLAAEHVHFATLETNGRILHHLLTRDRPAWILTEVSPPSAAREAGFSTFLKLGIRHIVSGLDHLLFLLVLMIACRRPRELVWAITGFTLGHSLTLGLASAGLIEPNLPAVEATIGLTIALVAVERAMPGTKRPSTLALCCSAPLILAAVLAAPLGGPSPGLLAALSLFVGCYLLLARGAGEHGLFRLLVTALFGLVHGMGFASAFAASRMQSDQWLWPLLGFNLGVELGQLMVVVLLGLAAIVLKRRPHIASLSAEIVGAAGCGMGVYWFVERAFA